MDSKRYYGINYTFPLQAVAAASQGISEILVQTSIGEGGIAAQDTNDDAKPARQEFMRDERKER